MHPATLYGFILSAIGLVGVIVLIALGDIPQDVGVPVITGLAGLGGGGALAIANPGSISGGSVGTIGSADPNA